MISKEDQDFIEAKGISLAAVNQQIERFKMGVKPLNVTAVATVGNGILSVTNVKELLRIWDVALSDGLQVVKFVPASGAASRMFKDLFTFMHKPEPYPERESVKTFFRNIGDFAFYEDLSDYLDDLNVNDDYYFKRLVSRILDKSGLGYGNLPKGLIKFHKYADKGRTPFEEHLVEGVLYAAQQNGSVHLHFTVSPEHKSLFEKLQKSVVAVYEKQYEVQFNITYSIQKPSTDTIAVDLNNEPFRENESILFRPGGHGALIENLNALNSDVVFIKNIDNVVPDHLKEATVQYKKVIGGKLIALRDQVYAYLNALENGSNELVDELIEFFRSEFFMQVPDALSSWTFDEQIAFLRDKLNRPIRVCGMVKNEGEPGGGPFIVEDANGTKALQIAEMSQINLKKVDVKAMVDGATHFNPVDLVCCVRDYKGNKFDLTKFVDGNTAFISSKSKDGRDLKALEHPGLWNGAMAEWNTVFVEVPIETFNPVKEVNDLLRPQHQGE